MFVPSTDISPKCRYMRKFTKNLYEKMQLSIQEISDSGMTGFDFYKTCYHETMDASKKLKEYILNYRFVDQKEEIEFFKEIKPRFQSKLMYFNELIQVEIQKPLIAEKRQLAKYYRRSSSHYASLASRNQIFLHYMRSQYDSGDHLLFVRSTENFDFIHTDLDLDEKYSTPASTELAKLQSYQLVIDYLAQKINNINSKKEQNSAFPYKLVWTGKKAAVIELAYAIESTKVVNNGKASVAQIMRGLEWLFNIDAGKYYRVFQNFRIRKDSRTLYMDECTDALNDRMDDSDINPR